MNNSTTERRRKSPVIIKLALAGVAVLGVGAALTSAAWTDNALFSASADSATVELQGRLADAETWVDADTDALAVQVGADELSDLVPGEERRFEIELRNSGSIPLMVGAPTIAATGDVFTGTGPATVSTSWAGDEVAAAGTQKVTVTVKTPADWAATYQGKTGALTLMFQAATTTKIS